MTSLPTLATVVRPVICEHDDVAAAYVAEYPSRLAVSLSSLSYFLGAQFDGWS
jgi:hypothetical protein